MPDLPTHLWLVTLTFAFAGLVKGVVGLGLPTVAIGLLSSVMTPAQAAALLVIPSLVTNVWQLFAGPSIVPLLRRLWRMMAGICVGVWAGSGVIAGPQAHYAALALGVVLVVYAVTGLARLEFVVPARTESWAGPLVGVATGLVTGATGVFVIPAVPYLAALDLERDELVQALGLSFTVSTVALAAGLAWHDALPTQALGASLFAVLPALLGMAAGGYLRGKVRAETFRLCFFIGLLALGIEVAWRAV